MRYSKCSHHKAWVHLNVQYTLHPHGGARRHVKFNLSKLQPNTLDKVNKNIKPHYPHC